MTDEFSATCRHCGAVVLQVPRIRDAEEQKLTTHLTTMHPAVHFYTPTLSYLLDHFIVRQVRTPPT